MKQCVNAVGDALKDLPGKWKVWVVVRLLKLITRYGTLRHRPREQASHDNGQE
jgi:hypothetical protein